MNAEAARDTGCRILALLWHAPHEVIAAGGFRRTYEIFKRAPAGVRIVALDDEPTFLSDLEGPDIEVREYRIPGLVRRLEKRFFWLERVVEWALSTLIMSARCVRMRMRQERFDVIFVPSSEQLPALVAGILARRLFKARLVACNLNIDIFPRPARRPIALLHNGADTVIAISGHLKSELEGYGVRKPVVINTVGLDCSAVGCGGAAGEPKEYDAVFVGRHDPEKGVFDLLRIWKSVTKSLPGSRLVMVGSCNPGNRNRLTRMLDEYGIAGAVTMVGTVDDDEKFRLIRSSKICLFPSHVEEWGLVPQEALACGLPAVVYDLPVYKENVADCDAVFRLPIGDTEAMAAKSVELLENDDYEAYREAGPRHVGQFDWRPIAEREFEILTEQCGTTPERRNGA